MHIRTELQHKVSPTHASLSPRRVGRPFAFDAKRDVNKLYRFGIRLEPRDLQAMLEKQVESQRGTYGMDAITQPITTPSIPTLLQFLQTFMPGQVRIMTAARKIDNAIGYQVVGSWEDEQVVQAYIELDGAVLPYGDRNNLQFASWNLNWLYRTVVRFQIGLEVEILEEKRAARVQTNSAAMKREACTRLLEIQRNLIGFKGYNNGANLTYGLLNDPNLPNYVTVAAGAGSSTLWSLKTVLEIIADLRAGAAALQNNTLDNIDPAKTPITLLVATAVYQFLTVTSEFGYSVIEWLNKNLPSMRIESAPELNGANGGANVFYMFAEKIEDESTDNREVISQLIQAKFITLGVEKTIKGYKEGFSSAYAGSLCKRPLAVYRATGV
jgi:hypothetical protein